MVHRKLYLAVAAALMNAVTVGICSTYSSTATESMKSSRLHPTDLEVSWIGSILPLGAIVGGLIAGYLANQIGRKAVMIYLSVPLLLGWLLIAYASSLSFIYSGRFITGLCCGIICVVTPMYIVEIAPPEMRGNFGCQFQLNICGGIIIVSALGKYLSWNWVAIASAVFAILSPICMLWVPESPQWLIMKGKFSEAEYAMKFLYGQTTSNFAELIIDNQDNKSHNVISLNEFFQPIVYKPALLSIGLMFFQQFSGSNALLYYTVFIFKQADSSIDPKLANFFVAFCMYSFTLLSCFVMDTLGRKKLLIISGIVTCLSLNVISIYLYMCRSNPALKQTYGWIPLACILFYIAAFSVGLGPIPWLMMSEMSPLHSRGLICGLGTGFSWIFVFIITKSFINIEYLIQDFGAYWLYSFFCVLCCCFTVFLPETKGKSFEEIQSFFCGSEPSVQRLDEVIDNEHDFES